MDVFPYAYLIKHLEFLVRSPEFSKVFYAYVVLQDDIEDLLYDHVVILFCDSHIDMAKNLDLNHWPLAYPTIPLDL